LAIVYDGIVLHWNNNITHLVLFCIAAGLWVLYLHEVLFRSGKVKVHWVKRRLADLGLMLLMALVAILLFTFISGLPVQHKR